MSSLRTDTNLVQQNWQTSPGYILAPDCAVGNLVNAVAGYRNESSGTTTPALLLLDHCTVVEVTNNATTGVAAPANVVAGFTVYIFNSTSATFTSGIAYVPQGAGWKCVYSGTSWLTFQSA